MTIDYLDTPDGFTVAQRREGIRLFSYVERSLITGDDENILGYVHNGLRRYQRAYIVDYVIHLNLQYVIERIAEQILLTHIQYDMDEASILGFVHAVDRVIRQAKPTHALLFASHYSDSDYTKHLLYRLKQDKINVEVIYCD